MSASSSSGVVQYLSFSPDNKAFACGHSKGFATFRADTANLLHTGAGALRCSSQVVRMLSASSEYVAVVGDGTSPKFPRNKVLIWKDGEKNFVIELEFKTEVLEVILSQDRIMVVNLEKLHVYTFEKIPKSVCVHDTGLNPKGLCALSALRSHPVIAFPSRDEGTLQITNLDKSDGVTIAAHSNALVCIQLSPDAESIATCSSKGTCIRIFNTATGDNIRELRRGVDSAEIRCMAFSSDATRLIVSSDKKKHSTIHVFALSDTDSSENRRSKFYGLRSVLPNLFSSEWSSCQFHCPEPRTICAFGPNRDTFVVVGFNGTIYTCVIDATAKNNCKLVTTGNFLPKL
eukprot:m.81345 g.81345  ORF g.81345 m.81345 type:complete len:345 (+) comp25409_c0_seq1:173-1207(+)